MSLEATNGSESHDLFPMFPQGHRVYSIQVVTGRLKFFRCRPKTTNFMEKRYVRYVCHFICLSWCIMVYHGVSWCIHLTISLLQVCGISWAWEPGPHSSEWRSALCRMGDTTTCQDQGPKDYTVTTQWLHSSHMQLVKFFQCLSWWVYESTKLSMHKYASSPAIPAIPAQATCRGSGMQKHHWYLARTSWCRLTHGKCLEMSAKKHRPQHAPTKSPWH